MVHAGVGSEAKAAFYFGGKSAPSIEMTAWLV